MSQKNESLILFLALLITGSLLGAGYFLFFRFSPKPLLNTNNPSGTLPPTSSPNIAVGPIETRISQGEKVLIASGNLALKQAGVAALASRQYQNAVQQFNAALQQNKNDPEALVYRNNAQILQNNQPFYTIAVSIPIGTSVNTAQEILRGVAQAQIEVNQGGGIAGKSLNVIIVNDDNSPEVAKEVAQKLVNNSEVLGVVGHFGSNTTEAAAPIYEAGKLVLISPTSTSTNISNAGDYIFRTVPSDRFAGSSLSRYLLNKLNLKKAVIFFNSANQYSNSLQTEFTTALSGDGGEIVSIFDIAKPDFNPLQSLEQARQQGAEVIVLTPDSSTIEQALQVVRINRRQLPLLGGDSLYRPETLKVGSDALGMVIAIPWHILANPNSAFAQTANQLWGASVNWRTATAYDATKALVAAIAKNPTRTGVQQALSASDFTPQGATGVIRFLPSGDRNQPLQLVTIEPGNTSGLGYDFVPVP
ncbi:ABC transporter substrate-binding protein [Planktothrix agardhii]|uniref:ABC transporter substrate-binding protein n=1 Tax=Planktothrix agardhii TaxID=1160 RepID=UPI001F3FAA18|nr:ABC transporter substrate-binding protein [Planktothrix agardhii]MCF3575594.1 ABC transporter substrate-binding protein [Planktothrix agardhii 1812]MCF3580583.1 ABC transporter substrate-binding protein [Planktothrix agardhii 1811]